MAPNNAQSQFTITILIFISYLSVFVFIYVAHYTKVTSDNVGNEFNILMG